MQAGINALADTNKERIVGIWPGHVCQWNGVHAMELKPRAVTAGQRLDPLSESFRIAFGSAAYCAPG
jgi:hypothetical protein